MQQLPQHVEECLTLYCIATGHGRETAVARLVEIGLRTWSADDYYMPERVCGRVRPVRAS
jgi:hypothetical protein